MVYLRPFSFTDDSASIAPLSDHQSLSSMPIGPEQQLFFHKIDPAIHLIQLRRLQSCSYQELYQSSRQILEEPWPVISKALKLLHDWASKMPDTLKEPMRRLIRSDLLCSNIMILSPPGLRNPLPEYGTALIFDYATEYAELASRVDEDSTGFAFWTFHDYRRAAYVSQRFLAVLDEGSDSLFNGIAPPKPQNGEPSSVLPDLCNREPELLLNRATSCLDTLNEILENFGDRFGDLGPWRTFESRRCQLLPKLRERCSSRTGYGAGMNQAS